MAAGAWLQGWNSGEGFTLFTTTDGVIRRGPAATCVLLTVSPRGQSKCPSKIGTFSTSLGGDHLYHGATFIGDVFPKGQIEQVGPRACAV